MSKAKLKKALCIAGLTSLLVNLSGSSARNSSRDLMPDKYDVSYDNIHYLDNRLNEFNNDFPYNFDYCTLDNIPYDTESSMVPQGLTITDDYILISSYDYFGNKKSTIEVLDFNGNVIHSCKLDIIAHVGGIAYDSDHNLVWVSNTDGTVNAYDYNTILNSIKVKPVYKELDLGYDLINYRNEPAVSYLTYYNNKLYVGNYTYKCDGTLKEYNIKINKANDVTCSLSHKYTVPTKVQGVTFYEYNNKTYIIFSRSSGTTVSSLLQIFNFNSDTYDENDKNSICYETPRMMEQVYIDDNKLYSIYESSAYPYRMLCNGGTDSIYVSDINLILKK